MKKSEKRVTEKLNFIIFNFFITSASDLYEKIDLLVK